MITAPKPASEERRLAALRSYSVLDTLGEESYDDGDEANDTDALVTAADRTLYLANELGRDQVG